MRGLSSEGKETGGRSRLRRNRFSEEDHSLPLSQTIGEAYHKHKVNFNDYRASISSWQQS
jgi:hypothetical protein